MLIRIKFVVSNLNYAQYWKRPQGPKLNVSSYQYKHVSGFIEHSSPEGNVGKKKGPGNFFQKSFFGSPLTMKIAFPKSELILLGSYGHFKFIG